MTFRVVVYGEGALDVGPTAHGLPGDALDERDLGSAHVLLRRLITEVTPIPAAAISFVVPLRDGTGRVAAGSALRREKTVRRLLAWPTRAPDLACVLVDSDADGQRRADLERWTASAILPTVIGVCVQEFESWLVGDLVLLRRLTAATPDPPPDPERAAPGEIKHWLRSLIGFDEAALRLRIAAECDLGELRKQRSFDLMARQLGHVLARRRGA